ncbi:hypothetical protein CB1_000377005 [Camelus ferus]|nr:hypothetical protein CB1_000377005 [Camelus ferus]
MPLSRWVLRMAVTSVGTELFTCSPGADTGSQEGRSDGGLDRPIQNSVHTPPTFDATQAGEVKQLGQMCEGLLQHQGCKGGSGGRSGAAETREGGRGPRVGRLWGPVPESRGQPQERRASQERSRVLPAPEGTSLRPPRARRLRSPAEGSDPDDQLRVGANTPFLRRPVDAEASQVANSCVLVPPTQSSSNAHELAVHADLALFPPLLSLRSMKRVFQVAVVICVWSSLCPLPDRSVLRLPAVGLDGGFGRNSGGPSS